MATYRDVQNLSEDEKNGLKFIYESGGTHQSLFWKKLGLTSAKGGKIIDEANIIEWNAIKLDPSFEFSKSYKENSNVINKIAFYVYNYTIFNHYKSIIEINPNLFEILVPENFDQKIRRKIYNSFKDKATVIRSIDELIRNNLIYETLVSNHGNDKIGFVIDKDNSCFLIWR